jgi:hypothetical protein
MAVGLVGVVVMLPVAVERSIVVVIIRLHNLEEPIVLVLVLSRVIISVVL